MIVQNRRRINLYRYFGRTDYEHPGLYHLVFNMNLMKMDDAVQIVCRLVTG